MIGGGVGGDGSLQGLRIPKGERLCFCLALKHTTYTLTCGYCFEWSKRRVTVSHSYWKKKKEATFVPGSVLMRRNREVGVPGSHVISEWACGYQFPWLRVNLRQDFWQEKRDSAWSSLWWHWGKRYHQHALAGRIQQGFPIQFLALWLPGTSH